MIRTIYLREYDHAIDKSGNEKPNELLGDFEVLQQISGREGDYHEQFIGFKDGLAYLVEGREVCGFNGGTRFSATELTPNTNEKL